MKITLLGTGTGLIRKERRSPAVLIETESETIIVDCGWGVPDSVNKIDFDLSQLTHLTISHRHADHMSAVPSLLQSQLIANIPHLPGKPRKDMLMLHGYSGIKEDIATICSLMLPELNVDRDLKVVEHTNNETHKFGNLTISAQPVRHVETMPAVSFCFETNNKKVVVTGDLGWDEAILTQIQDADLVIMDASASQQEYEEQPIRSHLAPIQCGELAARANVKHLVLTSFYDRASETQQDIIDAVRLSYKGKLTLPQDLQVIEID